MMEQPYSPWFIEASKRSKWLVGVSGGADSVALLHLLSLAGFRRLVVCHLNHRLRGNASTADARFTEKLALRLGYPFEPGSIDIRAMANGTSIEAAARHARLEFFAASARKWKTRRLILAHHADDQAETILWNLLRGANGPKGMATQKDLNIGKTKLQIHRPLLEIRKHTLKQWLKVHRLPWREDASNMEPFTIRNRLRHEAIPLLDAIAGRDAVSSLNALLSDACDTTAIRQWAIQAAQAYDPSGRIHLPTFQTLPDAMRKAVLADFLQTAGVTLSRELVDRCLAITNPSHAACANLPGGRRLRRRAARLWVEGAPEKNP